MKTILLYIARIFKPIQPIPQELRRNFLHLYFDIGWFGLLSGTSLAFLSIYATRIHASGQQIGFITAGPAIINLIFTLPAGLLLKKFRVNKAVFWASVFNRIFYASWIFLPLFVPEKTSIWLIILTTLIMNIPGSVLSVGFTVFFGDAVPSEYRSTVAGIRNAVVGLVTMLATLLSGQLLKNFSMETGYAIVFGIGFLGAAMSSFHLFMVKPVKVVVQDSNGAIDLIKPQSNLNIGILKGKFGTVIKLLVFFHFFQYLPLAIFPIYQINHLGLNEFNLSIGSTLFAMTQFLVSLFLSTMVRRFTNLRVMGLGMVLFGLYPSMLTIAGRPYFFYFISATGGIAAGLIGGIIFNYLLERMAEKDRPGHMMWYNLGLNIAVLGGSLLGPALAGLVGFIPALLISALGRSLTGAAILRWG